MAPRPRSTLLAAVAAALVLAGCGSSSEPTQSTPAHGSPPASTSTVPSSEAPVGVRAKPCGGAAAGNASELRVTGVSCDVARSTAAAWGRHPGCSSPAGASRTSCRLGRMTCLGARTDRGLAVTCAELGRSVSFIAKRP